MKAAFRGSVDRRHGRADRRERARVLGGFLARPSLSKTRILEWLLRLREFRYDESTELARRIGELEARLAQRALVIVLSDLHDPGALAALKLLAQRHDCAVLQLADPAEESLRGAGLVRVRENEAGQLEFTGPAAHAPLEQDELLDLALAARGERGVARDLAQRLGVTSETLPLRPFLWGLDSI